MIYQVRHRSIYSYENVSTFARCVLRLRPADSGGQKLIEFALTIEPPASSTLTRTGPFGETTDTVTVETPHDTLVVQVDSLVDVTRARIDPSQGGPKWESVAARSLRSDSLAPDSPANFLYPSFRAPIAPDITEYGRASFAPGRPVLAAATELMNRINADFSYDPEATEASTPVAEAFAARHGVCQDFAHIMIAALRGLGLPAAYVSGYLRTRPLDGRADLEGSDASHAWVAVWCGPEQGWIGFDPTNSVHVQDDHIVLATGRDYSDVAPIDGILLGPGDQSVSVEVDVIPLPDRVVRPDFGTRSQGASAPG